MGAGQSPFNPAAQSSVSQALQTAQTGNANGVALASDGYKTLFLEVAEANVGTATLNLEGSYDGTNWYAVGYQRVDAQASPARAVTGFSVTQNGRFVLQVLDQYPNFRARTSGNSGSVTVKAYALPI